MPSSRPLAPEAAAPRAPLRFRAPRLMGVVNVTPDSFYPGGRSPTAEAAVERALRLVDEGADFLDIGGQSTRPGSDAAPLETELARVIPVIKALSKSVKVPISVDTDKARVAAEALDAGARIVNDVSALRADPDMARVAARAERVVLMHMGDGGPKTMQADPRYVGPHSIRSTLLVPLRIGEERIGVMGIESTRLKAFHAEDEALLTAVSHQVAAAVRVARLHRAAEQAASTDALTGLPNRRVFFQRLEVALRAAHGDGTPLTVGLVDVDLLKQVNDQLGHGIGDEALQGVARILGAGVREQDVAARLGGDEFGVLFCGAPILVAERIMRRLAETVRSTTLVGKVHLPSISWGLAEATSDSGVDGLIDAADSAMYRHKRRARVRALAE